MARAGLPILWICGPPSVGKSTAAWQLYTASGARVGYVDIDQLGMCYPAGRADPHRDHVKAQNLGSVLRNFAAAGADRAVVSGVIHPDVVGLYLRECSGTAITFCLLSVSPETLVSRNLARGRGDQEVAAGLGLAKALANSDFATVTVETDDRDPAEVVRRIQGSLSSTPRWKDLRTDPEAAPGRHTTAPGTGGRALWLCGAQASGKSTVGFTIFLDRARTKTTAYVDLEQIGFVRPSITAGPDHRLRAANLGALWQHFRAAGADRLIFSGAVSSDAEIEIYRDALPGTPVAVCRLDAAPEALAARIRSRAAGRGPRLAGDDLVGQPEDVLAQAVGRSTADASALAASAVGDVCLDTSDRPVGEVAALVLARASGWDAEGG